MKNLFLFIIILFFKSCSFAQTPIEKILNETEFLKEIKNNPQKFPLQIVFSRIQRDSLNFPHIETYTYFTDKNLYFNPASTIKLAICALSLEKLHEINKKNVHAHTRIGTGKNFDCQTEVKANEIKLKNPPTIAKYIESLLLVSDNEGYTRLYEFLGQKYIQRKLKEKQYNHTKIIRRFTECDTLQNRYTNPIYFYNDAGELLHTQEMAFNNTPFYPPQTTWKTPEKATPMNIFNPDYENEMSLEDAHNILTAIMLPEAIPTTQRFKLSDSDYQLLWRGLGSFPHERKLTLPNTEKEYTTTHKKYLMYGRKKEVELNPNIRIFNIVGWWGGVVTDCAYIVDFDNKIEFLVSARIGINHNEISEGEAYQKYSFPFMEQLGQKLYEFEKSKLKEKRFLPNFDRLKKLWD
jgi:hypothetical protein